VVMKKIIKNSKTKQAVRETWPSILRKRDPTQNTKRLNEMKEKGGETHEERWT
jgi:hypothetical protein